MVIAVGYDETPNTDTHTHTHTHIQQSNKMPTIKTTDVGKYLELNKRHLKTCCVLLDSVLMYPGITNVSIGY